MTGVFLSFKGLEDLGTDLNYPFMNSEIAVISNISQLRRTRY